MVVMTGFSRKDSIDKKHQLAITNDD